MASFITSSDALGTRKFSRILHRGALACAFVSRINGLRAATPLVANAVYGAARIVAGSYCRIIHARIDSWAAPAADAAVGVLKSITT
jgi:hypothetical protein